jgi:acetyltransferase-like isoleucine patch superfamily enzyme
MHNNQAVSPMSSELSLGKIIGITLDTPWKLWNECVRLFLWPFAWLEILVTGLQAGSGWKWYGLPTIQRHRRSQIQVGKSFELRSTPSSNPLSPFRPVLLSTRRAGATLEIGDQVGMTGGSVVASEKITIGDRVVIGANTIIIDSDFHPLTAQERQLDFNAGPTQPIKIGDDVFIGTQSIILKGSTIGNRSVIGAGSVVSGSIPADVIAAGNPARVIKKLTEK